MRSILINQIASSNKGVGTVVNNSNSVDRGRPGIYSPTGFQPVNFTIYTRIK